MESEKPQKHVNMMSTFHTDLHYAESTIRDIQESELKYHEKVSMLKQLSVKKIFL